MSSSPYKRRPRLKVDLARHEVEDVVAVGQVRWAIRSIDGDNVRLEAVNTSAGIFWNTTLNRLPDPVKDHR